MHVNGASTGVKLSAAHDYLRKKHPPRTDTMYDFRKGFAFLHIVS